MKFLYDDRYRVKEFTMLDNNKAYSICYSKDKYISFGIRFCYIAPKDYFPYKHVSTNTICSKQGEKCIQFLRLIGV